MGPLSHVHKDLWLFCSPLYSNTRNSAWHIVGLQYTAVEWKACSGAEPPHASAPGGTWWKWVKQYTHGHWHEA